MHTIQELVYTEKLHKNEAKELLHCPQNDDLDELPLDFRLGYLRFQLRMKFINLLK